MAVKTTKKTVKKTTKAKTRASVKKKTAPGNVKKGDKYKCSVCGIAVTIDEACGCVDMCDIICCEQQMKPRKK